MLVSSMGLIKRRLTITPFMPLSKAMWGGVSFKEATECHIFRCTGYKLFDLAKGTDQKWNICQACSMCQSAHGDRKTLMRWLLNSTNCRSKNIMTLCSTSLSLLSRCLWSCHMWKPLVSKIQLVRHDGESVICEQPFREPWGLMIALHVHITPREDEAILQHSLPMVWTMFRWCR